MSREPFNFAENKEITESLHKRFLDKVISEEEYRRGLARQGFNATEIEAEIAMRTQEE